MSESGHVFRGKLASHYDECGHPGRSRQATPGGSLRYIGFLSYVNDAFVFLIDSPLRLAR